MLKKILNTLLPVLFSTLLLFLLLEGACILLGFPRGASKFVEGVIIKEKLSAKKPQDEIRIFAYGESTMHGCHYAPFSNPARWLEAYLKDFLPGRKIRVVNFSRMGQGSDYVYNSFRDTVDYHPDLAIFYLGHNQMLYSNRKQNIAKEHREIGYQLSSLMRKSRFLSAVARVVFEAQLKRKDRRMEDRIETEIIETAPRGFSEIDHSPRTSSVYWENIAFFRSYIVSMMEIARKRDVRALFMKPVSNLKDFRPYQSLHLKELNAEEVIQWNELFQKGKEAQEMGRTDEALEAFARAYTLDPTYADLCFRLGQIHFQKGDLAEAKKFFEEARDNDVILCRATRDILEVFSELQAHKGLELVDTEKALSSEVPGGIMGEPVIGDNVHFSVKGHSLAARLLAQEIAGRGWVAPKEEWQFDRERSFEEMEKDLGVTQELMFNADVLMVSYFGSRFENRVRYAKMALEIRPNDPRALRHLAWTYWLMGRKEDALATYEILKETDPASFEDVLHVQPFIRKALEETK